jgi:hypothetical protein
MKVQVETVIKNNSLLWESSNDQEYKDELHRNNEIQRKKLQDINNELKNLA